MIYNAVALCGVTPLIAALAMSISFLLVAYILFDNDDAPKDD